MVHNYVKGVTDDFIDINRGHGFYFNLVEQLYEEHGEEYILLKSEKFIYVHKEDFEKVLPFEDCCITLGTRIVLTEEEYNYSKDFEVIVNG